MSEPSKMVKGIWISVTLTGLSCVLVMVSVISYSEPTETGGGVTAATSNGGSLKRETNPSPPKRKTPPTQRMTRDAAAKVISMARLDMGGTAVGWDEGVPRLSVITVSSRKTNLREMINHNQTMRNRERFSEGKLHPPAKNCTF
jgi:hypothetical protein